MSEPKAEEAKPESGTFEAVLDKRTRFTLNDVRLILGALGFLIVSVFGGGWYAFGQVDEKATTAAIRVNEANSIKLDAVVARVAAVEERSQAQDAAVNHRLDRFENTLTRVVINQDGLRDDLRAAFPLKIPPRTDGGQ
jgi:hypothetical protein